MADASKYYAQIQNLLAESGVSAPEAVLILAAVADYGREEFVAGVLEVAEQQKVDYAKWTDLVARAAEMDR